MGLIKSILIMFMLYITVGYPDFNHQKFHEIIDLLPIQPLSESEMETYTLSVTHGSPLATY